MAILPVIEAPMWGAQRQASSVPRPGDFQCVSDGATFHDMPVAKRFVGDQGASEILVFPLSAGRRTLLRHT